MTADPTPRHRVLVVDDEDDIREPLAWRLEAEGHEVVAVATGAAALEAVAGGSPDLVILDMVLPDIDGTSVLRSIREAGSDAVVMLLSGKSDEVDRVVALASGADDFVLKPCSPLEIAARVTPFLRRRDAALAATNPRRAALEVDVGQRRARLRGQPLDLSAREFDVLAVLSRAPGVPLSREELLAELRELDQWWIDQDSVADPVRRLRERIDTDPQAQPLLRTVRGKGYVLTDGSP